MERVSVPPMNPAMLPPGAVVGSWRVVDWAGRGVHGAVYRAVSLQPEQAEPVALKLALRPGDPRFAREVELLSRVRHPSVPRLLERGAWRHPGGTLHPYLVMEWVDGLPLYEWAQEHKPSSLEVARVLSQLARALQAIHARGGLHRDVKGSNVLVRRGDGRAVLIDLGACLYAGAATLTPPQQQPGTPAYRAPEAWLFSLQFTRQPAARHMASVAEDLYALGVTACRLVTGEYPELAEPVKDAQGNWHLKGVVIPPSLLDSTRVEPPLRACILRMLSERPEERGSVEEIAEALERAARRTVPGVSHEHVSPRRQERSWRWGLAVAASVALIATGVWWAASGPSVEKGSAAVQAEAVGADPVDAGMTGLGDAAALDSTSASPQLQSPEVLTEETLPKPLPGQTRPDTKGRCPRDRQVPLNGGCWWVTHLNDEGCAEVGGYLIQGKCYQPSIPLGRRPTSDSAHKP